MESKHTRCGTSGTVWSWSPLLSFWSKPDHFLPVTQVSHCSSSCLGWICVWITSFFYRCWWGQSLLSAHRPQQWPVWSKLPQGTVWLGHPSANTDAIAGRADLLSWQPPHIFSKPSRWPWVTLPGTRRDRVPPLLGWRSCSKPSFSSVIMESASQRSRADTKLTDHVSLPRSIICSAVSATSMNNTASGFNRSFTFSLYLLNIFMYFLDGLNEKFLVIVTV